ncbi:MAG: anti-sigma F factor [Lachnospiraceae bacterium]|nr:anti-sigma F factor [Lachnospiraceae bacterium]
MRLTFQAKSCNEALARMTVAAFLTPLNPTLEELADTKTAVSEAVTNAIIHGYGETEGTVELWCARRGREVWFHVKDTGNGIADIKAAMEPMYTTKPEQERSGMGFSFMEAFTDELIVESAVGEGTLVKMKKVMG